MGQQIRPSQFITTYGPGAILEGPEGPRIIPGVFTLFGDNRRLAGRARDFEVPEPRLTAILGAGAGIVRVPTNAELGLFETLELYDTERFPTWSLCPRHGRLYQHPGSDCPQCAPARAAQRARREAVRFVVACPDGHLDDVNWHSVVPHTRPGCRPANYVWDGGGAALRFVVIRCPACGGNINLGTAYARDWRCNGRLPERLIRLDDPSARPGCPASAKIIQKGAANLRMPSLQSALTIPRLDTRLHLFFAQANVRPALVAAPPTSMQALLTMLRALQQQNMIPPSAVTMVETMEWPQIAAAIADVVNPTLPRNYRELLQQELRELRNAAEYGAPAQQSQTPGTPPYFEVVQSAVVGVTGPNGVELRVAPVSRLRVVLVQDGYRRMEQNGALVSTAFNEHRAGRTWYPGVELFGEGLFIDLDPRGRHGGLLRTQGPQAGAWQSAWAAGNPAVDQDETHPVHVWWHTLSHRLINALAVDSGYSSASIRERVYVDIDQQGDATGGILLYTVQPGGDGTLGGLIGLARRFATVLRSALRDDLSCSNDPLCGEERFDPNRVNGAACYGCLLVSETSCEHRNRWLDRNLLIANEP